MGDGWQGEAVREHFSVLNSSRDLQKINLDTKNVRSVVDVVNRVLQVHLQPKQNYGRKLVRDIAIEIIRQHEGNVKFGFIVIVTDRKENGKLEKIPIFVIQFGNEKVFIDINCFASKSWDACMGNTKQVVRGCKYSFPSEGHYSNDGRLQVKFASHMQLYRRVIPFLKWGLAIAGIAATALFNSTPIRIISTLMGLAASLLPNINDDFLSKITSLMALMREVKTGNKTLLEIIPSVFNILNMFHSKYKEELYGMASDIKKAFGKIWEFIRNMFSFKSNSVVPTRFLAIASCDNDDNSNSEIDSYVSQVFENCRNENVYHYNANKKSDYLPQDLAPMTKSILSLTDKIVSENTNKQPFGGEQKISENDFSDVYSSLQAMVKINSEEKFAFYKKTLNAAMKSSEIFNVEAYNRSLGIDGDPKTHFKMDAVNLIDQSPVRKFLVHSKSLELKEEEPVTLIQCMEAPDNKDMGLYRVIGRGQEFISAKSFVKALSKKFNIEEKNFVVKEENENGSFQITLIFDSYLACIKEMVTNDNVEGMMIILENPSK